MDEDLRGLIRTNRQSQNSHGDMKDSVGNGEAEKLTHMTHGHGHWCADGLREWGVLGGGGQRGTIETTVVA